MSRRAIGPVLALTVSIVLLAVLTRLNLYALRADTVVANLGISPADSDKARTVDEAVLESIERNSFSDRLRQRLNRPPNSLRIRAFRADVCEVRQLDFERFAEWRLRQIRGQDREQEREALYSSSQGHRVAGQLNSPASGVNLHGATAYCQALGGRLPWAEEWEAMAAGLERRLYPWGNSFSPQSWPYQEPDRNAAQACGTHPEAATPRGIQDLAGNVMEWSLGSVTADEMSRQPVAHGAPAVHARARALYALNAAWLEIPPYTRSHHLGFRCIYDSSPPPRLPWGGDGPRTVQVGGGDYRLGLPPDVRLARLAVLLPKSQLREARRLLSDVESGAHQLKVGRCEVSRQDYRLFLGDPLVRLGLFANENEPRHEDYVPKNWARQLELPELPVTGVSWWAADAFARWAGGRLPSVEEWQLLAAGPEGRTYPWGNEYESEAAVTGDPLTATPLACEAAGRDSNTFGIRHLAGNVSEWTRSLAVEDGNYAMWVQGGNWLLPGNLTTSTAFGRLVPLNYRAPDVGIRIVYD